jgi:hypothetical protein
MFHTIAWSEIAMIERASESRKWWKPRGVLEKTFQPVRAKHE